MKVDCEREEEDRSAVTCIYKDQVAFPDVHIKRYVSVKHVEEIFVLLLDAFVSVFLKTRQSLSPLLCESYP